MKTPLQTLFAAYFWNRQRAQGVPADADFEPALTAEASEFLVSVRECIGKQNSFHQKWLKDYDRYDIDTQGGELVLTRGEVRTAFDLQSLGSVRKSDSTWQWAWANPNVPERMSRASAKLKLAGKQYGLPYLEEGTVTVSNEQFPWFLGFIALKVTQLEGIFWAPDGDTEYYFLLSNPRTLLREGN